MASASFRLNGALSSSCQLAHPVLQSRQADGVRLKKMCIHRPGCFSNTKARKVRRLGATNVTRLSTNRLLEAAFSQGAVPSAVVESADTDGLRQQWDRQGFSGAIHTSDTPQRMSVSLQRRQTLFAIGALVPFFALSNAARAAESTAPAKEENPLDSIASFLDPDELAASGRKIPKAYKKQVREVVKTLKESLSEQQAKDFRRKADPAKEAIRGYIVNWRGAASVQAEESYTALERVLRALGAFYSKAGPNARVTDDLREQIFKDLDIAENSL